MLVRTPMSLRTIRNTNHNLVAGADIKEMKDKEFSSAYSTDFLGNWSQITKIRKPVIAAVSGYAVSYSTWKLSRQID